MSAFDQLAAKLAGQQRGALKVNPNAMISKGGGGGGSGGPSYPSNSGTYRVPLMPANPRQGHGRFSRPLQREHGLGREPAARPGRSRV